MTYKTDIWRPFDKEAYQMAWCDKKVLGIVREFGMDVRRCYQRVWRGFCDYDLFSICDWFLGIMPPMLEEFRDNLHGCPVMPDMGCQKCLPGEDKSYDEDMKAWVEILNRMIFLLNETDEERCSRKNPYEDAISKAWEEFDEKYGSMGEKLLTEEEIKDWKEGRGRRMYFLSDTEEYREINDQYMEEYYKIKEYQNACKDEALALFSKWFYDLWD